jgi:hypothetical protein
MDFVEVVQGKILEHLVHVGHELLELPEFLAKRLMEFCGTKNCSPCSTLLGMTRGRQDVWLAARFLTFEQL